MKQIAIIIIMLIGCLFHSNVAEAQKVRDAFVLVDVSGSMKYPKINSEAKQIISSMIQGNLILSDYPGWSQVKIKGLSGDCPLISKKGSPLVSAGGKVCILPFGNMNRVKEYKFVDMPNFKSSFDTHFPTVFRDELTYITLAKAYAVNIASKNNISGMVYMIIYSDGAEECTDGRVGYPDEFRDIVDYFGTKQDSFCQKKGIIRKSHNRKQFDIEIWTMGPIPTVVELTEEPTNGESKKIEISNQPKGKSPKVPIEINVEEPFMVRWKNATGTTKINIQIKKGNTYTNIPTSDKDSYYALDKKARSAEITFYESQDYKIIVADDNGRDVRYVTASSSIFDILKAVFPIIAIVVIIAGGFVFWQLFSKPKPPTGWTTNNDGNKNNSRTNNEDDWS